MKNVVSDYNKGRIKRVFCFLFFFFLKKRHCSISIFLILILKYSSVFHVTQMAVFKITANTFRS